MPNTCINIDISAVNSLGKIKADINSMSLEELQQVKKEYSEVLNLVKKRIGEIKPKSKRKTTKIVDKKESQASEPIRTREDVNRLIKYFLDKGDLTMSVLLLFGFNNGNRIGDIRKLTVGSILDGDGIIKSEITIEEEKNQFVRTLYFNATVQKALRLLLAKSDKTVNDYLFTSNGTNKQYDMISVDNNLVKVQKPLSIQAINDKIQMACDELRLVGKFSTHTMRKTCLNFVANENRDLFENRLLGDMAACAFTGHKSLSTTEKFYLSMSEQERKTVHERLNLGLEALNEYLNQ